MPIYEFKCQTCGAEFSATSKIKDMEQGTVKCPSCGGTNLRQLMTVFISKTSRKS